jgi:hypothetical protein
MAKLAQIWRSIQNYRELTRKKNGTYFGEQCKSHPEARKIFGFIVTFCLFAVSICYADGVNAQ